MERQRKNQRAQLPVSSVKTPKPEAKFASLPTSYAPRRRCGSYFERLHLRLDRQFAGFSPSK
jgi:hypothetical protein